MLDLMRRRKRLKTVLWLVIISLTLGMIIFFVPGAGQSVPGFEAHAGSVDGDEISIKDFRKIYLRMVDQFSNKGRNPTDPEMLRRLGIDRQALDSLISLHVIKYAAKRLSLDVSPEEMRRAIESNPALQDRGVFVGLERYKMLLTANNITVSEFEDELRLMMLRTKIRNVIADSMDVSERELRDEFQRSNQEAQVKFVQFKKDDFKTRIKPGEADLRAYFDSHKEKYRIGEQRHAQYLLFSLSIVSPTIQVTEQEIKERWEKQARDESVDASHILFEVKEADKNTPKDSEVKAKAEEVLKRAKSGEDFAELAKKYSQDPISAKNGGNLGPFSRGKMVKEFDDAAFKLKEGEISDLVKTPYGYHIIKALKHETPTLENQRKAIMRTAQLDKASELMKQKTVEAGRLAESQKDLSVVGKLIGIPTQVVDAPWLTKETDPYTNGVSPQIIDEVFRLKNIGDVGKVADHPQGYAIPKLLEVRLPKPPDFTDSRAAVEKDYIDFKATEILQAEAKKLADEAGKSKDLEAAAKKQGLKAKDSLTFKRPDIPDPELGSAPAFTAAAFDLPVEGISSVISLDGGNRATVLQVKKRTALDEAEFRKQREDIRTRLLSSWQDAYFQEYLHQMVESLERAGKIRRNQRAMDAITGLRTN